MNLLRNNSGFVSIYIFLFLGLVILVETILILKIFSQSRNNLRKDNGIFICQEQLKSCVASSAKLSKEQTSQIQVQNTPNPKDTNGDLKCQKEIDFWKYLPENLKQKTYKQGIVSPGQSTYDIFPLAWSKDCQRQAFLVELVGREGDAYISKDIHYRGVYIFDDKTQQIKLAYSISPEFTVDEEGYESNFWFAQDKYIFVVTTKKTKKEFISKRYEYDVSLDKIKPSGE